MCTYPSSRKLCRDMCRDIIDAKIKKLICSYRFLKVFQQYLFGATLERMDEVSWLVTSNPAGAIGLTGAGSWRLETSTPSTAIGKIVTASLLTPIELLGGERMTSFDEESSRVRLRSPLPPPPPPSRLPVSSSKQWKIAYNTCGIVIIYLEEL